MDIADSLNLTIPVRNFSSEVQRVFYGVPVFAHLVVFEPRNVDDEDSDDFVDWILVDAQGNRLPIAAGRELDASDFAQIDQDFLYAIKHLGNV